MSSFPRIVRVLDEPFTKRVRNSIGVQLKEGSFDIYNPIRKDFSSQISSDEDSFKVIKERSDLTDTEISILENSIYKNLLKKLTYNTLNKSLEELSKLLEDIKGGERF